MAAHGNWQPLYICCYYIQRRLLKCLIRKHIYQRAYDTQTFYSLIRLADCVTSSKTRQWSRLRVVVNTVGNLIFKSEQGYSGDHMLVVVLHKSFPENKKKDWRNLSSTALKQSIQVETDQWCLRPRYSLFNHATLLPDNELINHIDVSEISPLLSLSVNYIEAWSFKNYL